VVTKLVKENGTLQIDIDDERIEPLSFKSFRPTARNISDFAKAGVKLFSILSSGLYSILGVPYSLYGESWIGDHTYDFSVINNQIELFRQNAPEAYFALMLQLDTRPWFLDATPGCPDSFYCLSQVADYEPWRTAAADYLQAVLRHVEDKYGDRFYGYFLMGGTTTEWFSHNDHGEAHPYKEAAFQKYSNDPAAAIPGKQAREHCSDGNFKNPEADQLSVDYWRFHNEAIANTVLFFAAKAQEVLQHKKLVGVYFGYLFELDGERLWNDGHMAYEKIFLSPDIDMISSPSAYGHRHHGATSAFMVTYDTLALHNKLYYLEFDHITHLAPQFIEGHGIPGYDSKFENEQQTIDVMRRDFMLCITKGAALWWFDMFEGWFYSDGMMQEIHRMIAIAKKMSAIPLSSKAEIAVFAEGESLYYADKNANLNTDVLGRQRAGLAKMGAPYDAFTIADIDNPKLDHDQYKLYIFLDAFKMSEQTKKTINEKIKIKGKTVLWVYAADYVQDNDVSLTAMSEMTGMELRKTQCTDSRIEASCGEANGTVDVYGFTNPLASLFYIDDSQATIWGKYSATGKAALAYKQFHGYTSFYSGAGNLPANVLRKIAHFAGVHIYNQGNDPVYVNNRLIGVYSDTDGEINIRLTDDAKLEELFDGTTYETKDKVLKIAAAKGNAKLFLICM